MRKALLYLVLFFAVVSARADIITATLTVTNTAGVTDGQSLTINGQIRVFSNNVPNTLLYMLSGTNIYQVTTNIYASYSASGISGTQLFPIIGTNQVQWQGYPNASLTVTPSAGWATVSYSTNVLTNATAVRVPYTVEGTTMRATIANGLLDYINQSTSGQIALNHLTNIVVDTLSAQTISGIKTFTGGLIVNAVFTAPSSIFTSEIDKLAISNVIFRTGGLITSPIMTGGRWTNAILIAPTSTNQVAQNLLAISTNTGVAALVVQSANGYVAQRWLAHDGSTINGVLDDSGNLTLAGWLTFTSMTNNGASVFNDAATFNGDASFNGVVNLNASVNAGGIAGGFPGVLVVDSSGVVNSSYFQPTDGSGLTNLHSGFGMTLAGDTTNSGSFSWSVTNNSGLANGNNNVSTGSAVVVQVSGPTASFTITGLDGGREGREIFIRNRTGQSMTIANQSGLVSAGNRIETGTGSDLVNTNNPGFVHLIYDGVVSRWGVVR